MIISYFDSVSTLLEVLMVWSGPLQCLTSQMVQKYLKEMEVNFHISLINRSERRVLEQLDSRVC